ncbi:MAG: AAA family ATPase [Elusimicrobiota bacterium]|jgi:predicted AAA+ superfamily ATPase
MNFKRIQNLPEISNDSCFLWGPRQTGKSTLLRGLLPDANYVDLLLSDQFEHFSRRPASLRENILADPRRRERIVIIDEVQKLPTLLDEVQWLIVNERIRFILCGSSARKLKHGAANLLGGRAIRYELFPLVYPEIPDFNLERALNQGLLPRHYLADDAGLRWHAYVGDYLKEEVMAEALTRNLPAFSRFLDAAAFSCGEALQYSNVARDCGVSAPTVRSYFDILNDTLIGWELPAYLKRPKRRTVQASKFYFFDVGLANTLLRRGTIEPRSEAFGKAFEHWMAMELRAHAHYSGLRYPLSYWRTTSGYEVDFILGDAQIAVEVKSTELADERHWRGLKAFAEEYSVQRQIVVSRDPAPRRIGSVEVLPWQVFMEQLWSNKLLN